MIHKNRARASSLFLMELIIAILFFSAASAVCVQLFVKSHLLSQDAEELSHAVNECSGVAEVAEASDGAADCTTTLKGLYPQAEDGGDTGADLVIYYDKDFSPCTAEEAAYRLVLQLAQEDGMLLADIRMTDMTADTRTADAAAADSESENSDSSDSIYELHVERHIARGTGYGKK